MIELLPFYCLVKKGRKIPSMKKWKREILYGLQVATSPFKSELEGILTYFGKRFMPARLTTWID